MCYNRVGKQGENVNAMKRRIERVLFKLSQQYAPHLTPLGWDADGDQIARLQGLATQLADNDLLVLVGTLAPDLKNASLQVIDLHIQDWIKGYGQLYNLLARELFPTHSQITARFADNTDTPPIVVIHGQATPVIQVMARIIVPYVAIRQHQQQNHQRSVTELELYGLMDMVLDRLEASDLTRAEFKKIQTSGVSVLRSMLNMQVNHISLTVLEGYILNELEGTHKTPRKPTRLPEQDRLQQERLKYELELIEQTEHETTSTSALFSRNALLDTTTGSRRRTPTPPVPSLPQQNEAKDGKKRK